MIYHNVTAIGHQRIQIQMFFCVVTVKLLLFHSIIFNTYSKSCRHVLFLARAEQVLYVRLAQILLNVRIRESSGLVLLTTIEENIWEISFTIQSLLARLVIYRAFSKIPATACNTHHRQSRRGTAPATMTIVGKTDTLMVYIASIPASCVLLPACLIAYTVSTSEAACAKA